MLFIHLLGFINTEWWFISSGETADNNWRASLINLSLKSVPTLAKSLNWAELHQNCRREMPLGSLRLSELSGTTIIFFSVHPCPSAFSVLAKQCACVLFVHTIVSRKLSSLIYSSITAQSSTQRSERKALITKLHKSRTHCKQQQTRLNIFIKNRIDLRFVCSQLATKCLECANGWGICLKTCDAVFFFLLRIAFTKHGVDNVIGGAMSEKHFVTLWLTATFPLLI